MTSKELWAQYQHHTRDITEHGRKLGFAGAAICWFFRTPSFAFPSAILWALALFVFYFVFDLLHGIVGACRIKLFSEAREAKLWAETGSIDGDIQVPRSLDQPAFCFFRIKLVFLFSAFIAVAYEIFMRIGSSAL